MFEALLTASPIAVAGVSRDPSKFGYKVYRYLTQAGLKVYAVNPNADCIDDAICYGTVAEVPEKPQLVVTVTQPWITSAILKQCMELGVPAVWMQPGSEPRKGIEEAEGSGMTIVHGGPCIMVEHHRFLRVA